MDFILLTRNTPEANTFMSGFSCNQQIAAQPKFIAWLCLAGTDQQIIAMQNSSLVAFSAYLGQ